MMLIATVDGAKRRQPVEAPSAVASTGFSTDLWLAVRTVGLDTLVTGGAALATRRKRAKTYPAAGCS